VPDNGARLREMVDATITNGKYEREFADWIAHKVRFCSSLVDRITTGRPAPADRVALDTRLGYVDEALTITETDSFWAVEAEPDILRASFPIDDRARVIFAPDISLYRNRKLRLLNGAHTAMAPLALIAGVSTVRDATEHPRLGPLWRQILFEELVAGSGVPRGEAFPYAGTVWDRFCNPWLEHQWTTIATNQREKMRIRVIPSIVEFGAQHRGVPKGLMLALAAHVRFLNLEARILADATEWGADLASIPGVVDEVTHWLAMINENGIAAAIDTLLGAKRSPETPSP
jgi:tagaturonate reductase